MENIDRMIFDSLKNDLHWYVFAKLKSHLPNSSFTEDGEFTSLKDFGSDQVVEGIVRCLWRCDPNTVESIPSFKLPGNAVDRFRIASKISKEIKSLGIREQIGYQALLYPNVFDSRRIFLALFEKLPKETVKVDERKLTPLEKLKADVAEAIARQMAQHWVPEFCRFYEFQRIGRFWHPKEGQSYLWHQIDKQLQHQREENKLQQQQNQNVSLKSPPKIGPKPKLPPKPKIATPSKSDQQKDDFVEGTSSQQKVALSKLQETLAKKRASLAEKRVALMELNLGIARELEELQQAKKAAETNDERLLVLLEDSGENLEKLKHFVAEANSRRMALQEKFFAAKAERLEQLGQSQSGADSERLAQLQRGIGELEDLLEERRRIRAKLLKECQKSMGTDQADQMESRNKFVRRILEISAMVAKQNEEIRKTANSVQQIRREIGQLEGNLDRTFTAVNRWMGGTLAERDAKMQRAHKVLVRTHEQCALVMEAIQSQGQMSRQMDELGDRVDLEAQKGVDEQLEQLLSDLMLIRNENHELEMKINGRKEEPD